jgi:hypothetical protein
MTKRAKLLSSAACAALLIFVFRDFLLGKLCFTHDSCTFLMSFHLFFNSLFSGALPRWSPQLNCGQPLWVMAETLNVFDPAAFAAWLACRLCGADGATAYQLATVFWLAAFGLGTALCSALIIDEWWVTLSAFLLGAAGPLAEASAAQSNFFYAFRYMPLLLWLYLRCLKNPTRRNALWLGLAAGLSWGGYQTAYLAVYAAVFAAFYALCRYLSGARLLREQLKALLIAALVALPLLLPGLVAAQKMAEMAPASRKYFNFGWTAELPLFTLSFIDPFKTLLTWHGSLYLGCACAAFAAFGLWRLIANSAARNGRAGSFEAALALASLALFIPMFGLFGAGAYFLRSHALLTIRNWGFFVTPLMFALIMFASYGFKEWRERGGRGFCLAQAGLALFAAAALGGLASIMFTFPGYAALIAAHARWYRLFAPCVYLACACAFYAVMRLAQARGGAAHAYFAFTAASLMLFSGFYFTGLNSRDRAEVIAPSRCGAAEPARLPQFREWREDLSRYLPFSAYAPAARGFFTAAQEPMVISPSDRSLVLGFAYLLNNERLDYLLHSGMTGSYLQNITGVSAPIARLAGGAYFAASPAWALEFMRTIDSPEFFNRAAIIETPEGTPLPPSGRISAAGDYKALPALPAPAGIYYDGSRAVFSTAATAPSFLYFSDNWDAGWKAFLDGKSCAVYRADYIGKAVFVPTGNHTVEFRYTPTLYIVTFWIRAAAFVLLLAALCLA